MIDFNNYLPDEQRCTSIDPQSGKRCRHYHWHRGSCSAIPDNDNGKTEHRWWKETT